MHPAGRSSCALVALLFGVGCGATTEDAPDAPTSWTNGSRLRARVIDGGRGAVLFVGWQDTLFDVACGFELAEDGSMRCMPWEHLRQKKYPCSPGELPAAGYSCRADAPFDIEYLYDHPVGECATRRYPVRIRRAIASESETVTCADGSQRSITAPDADLHAFEIGEIVDPSEFVAAEIVEQRHGSRLTGVYYAAEDGARELAHLRDDVLGARCTRQYSLDDSICLPETDAYGGGHFSDSSCSSDIVESKPLPGCAVPFAQVDFDSNDCEGPSVYRTGEPYSGPLYHRAADTCALAPTPTYEGLSLFTLGAPLAASDLAPLGTEHVGSGRYEVVYRTTEDGARVFHNGALRERATGQYCWNVLVDGQLYCLSDPASLSCPIDGSPCDALPFGFFSDALCQDQLVRRDACSAPPSRVLVPLSGSCTDNHELRSLTPYDGPVYYSDGTTCVESPDTSGLLRVGDRIEPTEPVLIERIP